MLHAGGSVDILPAGTIRVLHCDASLCSCNVGQCIWRSFHACRTLEPIPWYNARPTGPQIQCYVIFMQGQLILKSGVTISIKEEVPGTEINLNCSINDVRSPKSSFSFTRCTNKAIWHHVSKKKKLQQESLPVHPNKTDI
jgi:hypothetical protein